MSGRRVLACVACGLSRAADNRIGAEGAAKLAAADASTVASATVAWAVTPLAAMAVAEVVRQKQSSLLQKTMAYCHCFETIVSCMRSVDLQNWIQDDKDGAIIKDVLLIIKSNFTKSPTNSTLQNFYNLNG